MHSEVAMKLLDNINAPQDIKRLNSDELNILCGELNMFWQVFLKQEVTLPLT